MPSWDDIIGETGGSGSYTPPPTKSGISSSPSSSWEMKSVKIDRFGSFSYFQEKQSPDKIFVDIDEFNNLPLLSRKVAADIFP